MWGFWCVRCLRKIKGGKVHCEKCKEEMKKEEG